MVFQTHFVKIEQVTQGQLKFFEWAVENKVGEEICIANCVKKRNATIVNMGVQFCPPLWRDSVYGTIVNSERASFIWI